MSAVVAFGVAVAGAHGAHGAHPSLSEPRGGDVTLGCWGYAGSKAWVEKPRPHINKGDGTRYFLNDMHSEETAEHPHGAIDVGIDGKNFHLFADRGATLTRGGRFRSEPPSTAILAVAPGQLVFVHDAHQEEESALAFHTEFQLVHEGHQLKVPGIVFCAVYDFEYFFKNACPNTRAKVGAVCR